MTIPAHSRIVGTVAHGQNNVLAVLDSWLRQLDELSPLPADRSWQARQPLAIPSASSRWKAATARPGGPPSDLAWRPANGDATVFEPDARCAGFSDSLAAFVS